MTSAFKGKDEFCHTWGAAVAVLMATWDQVLYWIQSSISIEFSRSYWYYFLLLIIMALAKSDIEHRFGGQDILQAMVFHQKKESSFNHKVCWGSWLRKREKTMSWHSRLENPFSHWRKQKKKDLHFLPCRWDDEVQKRTAKVALD